MKLSLLSHSQIRNNYLDRVRYELLRQFKSNSGQLELRLPHQTIFGGISEERYKKQNIPLELGERLDIITNQNLSRDTTILWSARGSSVKAALRMGQLQPQALTSKVIKALGRYHLKRANREIESQIQSCLNGEKCSTVDRAQDCIETLQDLERQLGKQVPIHDPELNADETIRLIEEYQRQQVELEEKIKSFQYQDNLSLTPDNNARIKAFYDLKKISELCLIHDNKIAALKLKTLIQQNRKDAEWLQTSGQEEIFYFLKCRCYAAVCEMEEVNQKLTYQRGSGAHLRGVLHEVTEEAIDVIDNYPQDFHVEITRDHQLSYPDEQEVIIDSDFHTHGSTKELEELMMAISCISSDNSALKREIKKTSMTRWLHKYSYLSPNPYEPSLFNSWEHFLGEMRNLILLSIPNIIETMILGNKARWVAQYWYNPPDDQQRASKEQVGDKTDYHALIFRIKQRTSISTKIGWELHKIFNYLLMEGLVRWVWDAWNNFDRFFKNVITDFQNQEISLENALEEMKREFGKIDKHEEFILELEDLKAKYPLPQDNKIEIYYAQPDISLQPYDSHGLCNGVVKGLCGFLDLYGGFAAKHPFTFMISCAAAGASLVIFFNKPLALKLFGGAYVRFVELQGYMWTKDFYSAAVAAAVNNFQITALLQDAIQHGPDGLLVKGGSYLWNDPAITITYTTLAWGIGYSLVYLVDIPVISEELRKQIGNPAIFSEIFGGAKMGFLAYQLISNPYGATEMARKEYVDQALQNYQKLKAKRGSIATAEEDEFLRAMLDNMLAEKNLESVKRGVDEARERTASEERNKLLLVYYWAVNKNKLPQLSALLKAKLERLIPQLTASKDDAVTLKKSLNSDKYMPRSTLRSFLSRAIAYFPMLIRCILMSPFAWLYTGSFKNFIRPWQELGEMALDDFTSTVYAVLRLVDKVMGMVFNRLPRVLGDVVGNSIIARLASYIGYDEVTTYAYQLSAGLHILKEKVNRSTTGLIANRLARANTSPPYEMSMRHVLHERAQTYSGGSDSLASRTYDTKRGESESASSQLFYSPSRQESLGRKITIAPKQQSF